MAGANQASLLLQKQLREPVDGFSAGLVDDSNVLEWNVTIIGPPDTLYAGGYFNAIMSFPSNYPNSPPTVLFTSEMWHLCPDRLVCISILHPPGDDPNGYELASERWSPVHTVESIVLSIISMLSSPNDKSPANIEAAVSETDSLAAIPRGLERAKGCIQKESKPCCPMLPRTAVSSKEFSLSIKTAAGARSSMVLGSQALCCTFSDLVWFAILLIELLIC